jgi:hypothetical protein
MGILGSCSYDECGVPLSCCIPLRRATREQRCGMHDSGNLKRLVMNPEVSARACHVRVAVLEVRMPALTRLQSLAATPHTDSQMYSYDTRTHLRLS